MKVALKSDKQHINLESVQVHRDFALQGKMFVNFIVLMLTLLEDDAERVCGSDQPIP